MSFLKKYNNDKNCDADVNGIFIFVWSIFLSL